MTRLQLLAGLLLLGVAFGATVRAEERRLHDLRTHSIALAMTASNDRAARDSTRVILARSTALATVLGDSLRLVERRVVQVTQHRDALDSALGRERIARYSISAAVAALDRVAQMPVPMIDADSADATRRMPISLRQAPYTVTGEALIPPHSDSGRVALHIALDSLPLAVRLRCSPPDSDGIRSADISATGPTWAAIRFGRVEQDAELCAASIFAQDTRRRWGVHVTPLVLAAGRTLVPGGFGSWALLFGLGLTLGG